MTVNDPGGVPVLGSPFKTVYSNMTFTDTLTAAPAPSYSFALDLHTINSAAYFDGFHDAYTALALIVNAYDSGNTQLWSSGSISRTGACRRGFDHARHLGFADQFPQRQHRRYVDLRLDDVTGVLFELPQQRELDQRVGLHRRLAYRFAAVDPGNQRLRRRAARRVHQFLGANYSKSVATPEPASCLLAALGLAMAAGRK